VTVEVLYLHGCPGYAELLPRLRELVVHRCPGSKLTAIEIADECSAVRHRFLGSPTIRVNGRDIEPGASRRDDYGLKCRLYRTTDGIRATPPDQWLLDALASTAAADPAACPPGSPGRAPYRSAGGRPN
jgi:hypothetical protein